MTMPPIPPDETERLHLLHALELLDSEAEPAFDLITRLVSQILHVPIALVSLVDENRQWFKSRVGLDATETPREFAFCAHTIMNRGPMLVQDATQDERFADNPLVTGQPKIRFYAGMPIRSAGGLALGTLCAIDSKPRVLTPDEVNILIALADLINKEVQMREAVLLTRSQMNYSQKKVQAIEARFRTVFERAGVGIALVAPDGSWISMNEAFCQIVGYSKAELFQLTFQDITYPEDLDADLHLLQQLVADKIDRYQLEKRYIRKNGSTVWVNLVVTKYVGQNGELDYFVSIIKDTQDRKEAEESLAALRLSLEVRVLARTHDLQEANEKLSLAMAQKMQSELVLRKREAELSMVIESANDAYVCMDQAGVIIEWNHQAEQTFGWSASEAIGCALDELIIPPEMREAHRAGMKRYHASGEHKVLNQRLELMALRRDGSVLPTEVRVRALHIEGHVIFSAFLHDITEHKQAELKREHEARHDVLTGLPNRRMLFELIPHAIARVNRQRIPLAIVFLDLDGFKAVNDTQGHEAGDAVLCAVAQRLRESVRDTDTVVRLAGDEFTLILEFLSGGVQDARLLAEKLLLRIQEPIFIGKNTAHVSASIGITLYLPGSEITPNQLVSTADAAMYEAKRAGKSRVCVQ
ncbi:PAS domain S-box protein [Iodobacter fluviatilis]|uniref:Sensor domain-containing diguanylate cyclase n=1 Tax=Iodobacter fluviatilis TaxID=537 RepID=A0A7G3GA50_9NEIS|nr:PAS domain S-box protein [Iodobacter fluviatilis]QBC44106.1 sensor domain-containing diguanylate cyclase [Iodobacter fluviatilis]